MFGNHLADRVSLGDYSSVDITAPGAVGLTFTMEEVMELITSRDVWYWAGEDGRPTLKSYDEIRGRHALEEYLLGRDVRRGMVGLERKWATRSVSFAAAAAELHLRSRGDQARLCRIAWDYTMHGGNKTKMELPGDHSCTLCGGVDSAEHWMAQCMSEVATVNRAATGQKVLEYIESIGPPSTLPSQFARTLNWLVNDGPGSGMHRMGMYLRDIVHAIFERLRVTVLSAEEIEELRKHAIRMTRIWIAGVLEDYNHKMTGKKGRVNNIYEANKEKGLKKAALAQATALKSKVQRKLRKQEDRQAKLMEYREMERREL